MKDALKGAYARDDKHHCNLIFQLLQVHAFEASRLEEDRSCNAHTTITIIQYSGQIYIYREGNM
jgi:hypothetical protein